MHTIVKLLTAVLVTGFLVGCDGSGSSSSSGNTSNTTTPVTNIDCSDENYIAGTTTCETASNITFAFIPNGTFLMGSNASDSQAQAYNDEKPQHSVTLTKDFFIGVTEVTQGEWKAIMGNNPSTGSIGDNYPVETISWNDAHDFIDALNAAEPNITIDGVQYRYALPTEAQWEYAARAGTQTRYYFGDDTTDIDANAWWGGNSWYQTHEVAQKLPNAWGLYDIIGNVWEFVEDYYYTDFYTSSPDTDPLNNTPTSYRVTRGGSWFSAANNLRSALRSNYNQSSGYYNLGFRLVLVSDR